MFRSAPLVLLAAWSLSVALAGCSPPTTVTAARGREVYQTCQPCHGNAAGGRHDLGAPALAGMADWYLRRQLANYQSGMRGAHPDDLEGARMRPMAKTLYRKQDLESVVLYLAALPPVKPPAALAGGDAAAGEARYALCATCHGPRGAGMPEMQAPRIAGQADWYLYRQLQKFKSGMRGAHPGDAMGAQMAAMAQTLEDTTAMKDVVAYVRTLAP